MAHKSSNTYAQNVQKYWILKYSKSMFKNSLQALVTLIAPLFVVCPCCTRRS